MALFKVTGMSCGHCVKAVENAVHEAAPRAKVTVDLAAGTVRTDGIGGTISTGDEVEILPSGLKTTVRSLESHN
ncbi:cation transporter, partial [Oceanibaculum nanhaiense]|uniref:cation transporter n=1 Tax=Oceanibaculum nanhaiense TaxID=1909734 RepID=UPI00396E23A2